MSDLRELAWPLLASEVTASGASMAMDAAAFGLSPEPPVLLAAAPEWMVRVRRRPGLAVVEEIIPDADPEVPRTFDESAVEPANELGETHLSVYAADALDIQHGDVVAFFDRGLCIGGGVLRTSQTAEATLRGEGKRERMWAGVRPLGILEEGPVLPARGLGSIAQDRIWGWFGITYDDSAWIPANTIAVVGSGYWWSFYNVAPDLEDRTAMWVFAYRRAGDPPMDMWAPGGECLFRQEGVVGGVGVDGVSIPAGVTEVEVEWAGDVYAEMYFEGESLGVAYYGEGEGNVERRRVPVVSGQTILVAVACANDPWDVDPVHGPKTHNPGGALWAVHWVDPGSGQRGGVIMHSDSSAVMLEYVARRPGVTPGQVLLEILAEVQSYGWCLGVTPTFTATADSGGRPWAEVGEIGTKVGYSLWKLTQQLISVYIDSDLHPDTIEWHAWSKGTRGRHSGVAFAQTTDPETSNVQEHVVTETLRRGNDILSYSKFGWQLHRAPGPGELRVAATLGLGALPSLQEVERWALAELNESSTERTEHDMQIEPVGDGDKPKWAFDVGDTVLISGEPEVVQQIEFRRDREGRLHWNEDEEPPPEPREAP